jgi:hypothetical protein
VKKLNIADRIVAYTIAIVLLCVAVRAVLDVAATVVVPAILVGAAYLGFRLWQTGTFDAIVKKMKRGGAHAGTN